MTDLGSDISCLDDCQPDMGEVTGRLGLAQAIARRLITPRSGLIDDPNYGYDLRQHINDDLSSADIVRIQDSVKAECIKDERVFDADVTVTLTGSGVLIVKIILTDADGPFTLVLSITEVSVDILTVSK